MPSFEEILTSLEKTDKIEQDDLVQIINDAAPHLVDPVFIYGFIRHPKINDAILLSMHRKRFCSLIEHIPFKITREILTLPLIDDYLLESDQPFNELMILMMVIPERERRVSLFFESTNVFLQERLRRLIDELSAYQLAQIFDLIANKETLVYVTQSQQNWTNPLGRISELACFDNIATLTWQTAYSIYFESVINKESIQQAAYKLSQDMPELFGSDQERISCYQSVFEAQQGHAITSFKDLLAFLKFTTDREHPHGFFDAMTPSLEKIVASVNWSGYKLSQVYRILSRDNPEFLKEPYREFISNNVVLEALITYETSASAGEILYTAKQAMEVDPDCDLKPFAREINESVDEGVIVTDGDDFEDIFDLALTLDEMWTEDWDYLLNQPGVREHLSLKPGESSLEDINDLLDCFGEKFHWDSNHLYEFLSLPNMMHNLLMSLKPADRWELLATHEAVQNMFVAYVATAQGEKLFECLNEMTQDKESLSIVVNLIEEGYEKLDGKEGLSEVQWKKFHFFHPVTEKRPFLEKLRKEMKVSASLSNACN